MSEWFKSFASGLQGGDASSDLVGAGKSSREKAMAHYKFQYEIKIHDAVKETFPRTVSCLGEDKWNELWPKYLSKKNTFRSLDYYGKDFSEFLQSSDVSEEIKNLIKFEEALDSYPWTHENLNSCPMPSFDEESKLILGDHLVMNFSTHVTSLYEDGEATFLPQSVIIWIKDEKLLYRDMDQWEVQLLHELKQNVGEALANCSASVSELESFFKWLGSSFLIRSVA